MMIPRQNTLIKKFKIIFNKEKPWVCIRDGAVSRFPVFPGVFWPREREFPFPFLFWSHGNSLSRSRSFLTGKTGTKREKYTPLRMGILDEIDGFSNEIYKKFPKFEHFLPNFIQIFENLCPVLIFFFVFGRRNKK